ncbi:tetratricopeptide repeat protein [uncultured Brachyspira sp.]|uniref:tetratricopeptide repeat protein n=1 Tax=uncultured Brachyspira sp. TaxID=221953 RepID=UPI0025F4B1C4|nr:tetratricopeptide repeat protein [uncultured Brachyspira sp.]
MKKSFVFLVVLVFLLISCASAVKISVEEENYPKIIAEKAYNEFGKNYKNAIAYYQYIIDNFDRDNYAKDVAWAYYEIGFCYYYQNKYEEALKYFNIVINNFTVLPPRILAQKVMQDIYEKKPKLKPLEVIEEEANTEENIDS